MVAPESCHGAALASLWCQDVPMASVTQISSLSLRPGPLVLLYLNSSVPLTKEAHLSAERNPLQAPPFKSLTVNAGSYSSFVCGGPEVPIVVTVTSALSLSEGLPAPACPSELGSQPILGQVYDLGPRPSCMAPELQSLPSATMSHLPAGVGGPLSAPVTPA